MIITYILFDKMKIYAIICILMIIIEHIEEAQMIDEFLKIDEVGKILKVPVGTLHRWKKERGLPAIKVGKALRFKKSDVLKWFESHAIKNKEKK